MRGLLTLALALLPALFAMRAQAAAPPIPPRWDAAMRSQTLTRAENALDGYVFIDKIPAIKAALEAHRAQLVAVTNPQRFADAVTSVLYGAAHDKHLGLWYSQDVLPDFKRGKPTPADIAAMKRDDRFMDYGYESSARLLGNIGYFRLAGFPRFPGPKRTLDETMALLDQTDALILDLRDNGGGDPRTVNYLLGYFFPKRVEVTGFLWRKGARTSVTRMYAASVVGASRYLRKPVYVLTSSQTISGGEQFAYDLQALHRAQVVGQTTAGGANIGGPIRLNDHFSIFIPVGMARNPYTHTNWEGTGVVPNVATKAGGALLEAYGRALRSARDSYPQAARERAAALKNPTEALRTVLP